MKNIYIYLFLIIFNFALIDAANNPVMCNGQSCNSDCNTCNLCNSDTCKLTQGCYCASTSIPGNIDIKYTPQFIYLSLRGGIKESFVNQTNFTTNLLENSSIIDSNGCPVIPTLYITNDETDYNVANLFQKIGALGFQSVTNKVSASSSLIQLAAEFTQGLQFLQDYGQINTGNIKMVKNPNNQLTDKWYSTLKSHNFTIDSSISENPHDRNSSSRLWPYTLDFGLHDQKVCSKDCPTGVYPKLWEFVTPSLYDSNNSTISIWDLDMSNYTESMQLVQNNFWDNYNSNRAPFGLVLDLNWFYSDAENVDPMKFQFIQELYAWMGSMDNVLFASEDQIINWMINPKPYINTKPYFKCRATYPLESACNGVTPAFCDYPNDRSSLKVCLAPAQIAKFKCPAEYPNIRAESCGDKVCTLGLDDCTCSDCEQGICRPNWAGNIIFSSSYESNNYVCGNLIYNNPNTEGAMNFIITLKIYWGILDKVVGARWITYDNNTEDCISHSYRIKPYLMSVFYPETNYSFIQICVNKSKSGFRDDFIQLGIEIISPLLNENQTLIDYDVGCGNSVCQEGERGVCNVDCIIPFFALFEKRLIVNVFILMILSFMALM